MEELALFGEELAGAGEDAQGFGESLKDIGAKVAGAFQEVASALRTTADVVSGFASAVTQAMLQAVSGLADVIGQATKALLGPFQQLTNAIAPFVSALNPTIMNVLAQSFRDLQATIGVAFLPIAQGLVSVFRQMAGALLPLMQALQPIFANLIQTIANIFIPILRAWADIFKALAPVLEFVSGVFRVISEAMQVYYTVLRTVIQATLDWIKGLFGGVDLKDVLKSFRSAMQETVKALVLMTAYIAKAFGQLGFIDRLIANFQEVANPPKGAIAAPTNAGITNFEGLAREFATAAFVAQQGGGVQNKDQLDYIKEIAASLEDVKNNGKSLRDYFNELKEKLKLLAYLESLFKDFEEFKQWAKGEFRHATHVVEQGIEGAKRGPATTAGALTGAYVGVRGLLGI